MMDRNLVAGLGEIAMEHMVNMRAAQETDKLRYFDTVLEGTVESNAILLQKLYDDIISKSNIDFGAIPDSKGCLTKYKEYKLITSGIDYINQLFEGTYAEEVELMNKLHDMIIVCRKDFEYGYMREIEIIKLTYCTAVYALHEMINFCVLLYTKQMRQNAGIQFDFRKTKKQNILLLRNVKGLIRSYNSGQWATIMEGFRKNPTLGIPSSPATEAGPISIIVDSKNTGEMISSGMKTAWAFAKNIPSPVKWIIGAIAIFLLIRALIYYFYQAARGVKDEIRSNKEFVDFAIVQEREEGAPDKVISKHTKLSERLESIANFIEVKILKQNAAAEKELTESNRSNFQASDFKNPSFGGDITF